MEHQSTWTMVVRRSVKRMNVPYAICWHLYSILRYSSPQCRSLHLALTVVTPRRKNHPHRAQPQVLHVVPRTGVDIRLFCCRMQ